MPGAPSSDGFLFHSSIPSEFRDQTIHTADVFGSHNLTQASECSKPPATIAATIPAVIIPFSISEVLMRAL